MPFAEMLRAMVFLTAGGATLLAVVAVIGAQREQDQTILLVGALWWAAAAWIGMTLGGAERSAERMREPLASARTVTPDGPGFSLPAPGRIAFSRLWPVIAAVLVAGVAGLFFPEVALIGSGFALLVALAWRNREAAVLAIELRDGVRFLVVPGSAFKPVKLIRSPGFTTY